MAFDSIYLKWKKDIEYNILPLFDFKTEVSEDISVEDIGSKTTVTYQGNGKYDVSTSAPNYYFKTRGYNITYERKKAPTGRKLELENKFEEELKKKGMKVDDTKYVPRDVLTYYAEGHRPKPNFPAPNNSGLIGGGIACINLLIVSVFLVGIVFADKIVSMIPEFLAKFGVGSMQVAYPLYCIIFGAGALCFYAAYKRKHEYDFRLKRFNERLYVELSAEEKQQIKDDLKFYAEYRAGYKGEMLEIVCEMIDINNHAVGE